VVKHPGDVVIFGDVNPGGKVIADGDVVVLGSLRGTVQAGANDGEASDASIMALALDTARLQIGTSLYQHAPSKGKNGGVPLPVIARVRRGGVEVMPFTGSFHRKKERKPLWQEKRM
jgi:septum site-determining protein MinC